MTLREKNEINQNHFYFQEQALSAIKLNGRNDMIESLNKQVQLNQTKAKETNGHLSKVSKLQSCNI